MKVIYDWDKNTRTYTCQACWYKYTEETGPYSKVLEGDKTFIEMEGFEFHSTDREYYYPSHNTHTVYACPKCGTLQIQV